jgi:hypothetical protein
MPSAHASALRRYWWAFLLATLAFDLLLPLFYRFSYEAGMGRMQVLIWIPLAIRVAARVALVALIWPSLKEGGRVQTLLALQAAIPLAAVALSRFLLPALFSRMSLSGSYLYLLSMGLPLIAEVAALCTAFWLRPQEPEEGELGVAASAGLAVLGEGWIAVGLLPLLTRIMKDPFLHELTGAHEDAERAASRASLTGFLLLFGSPLLVWSTFRPGAFGFTFGGIRMWLLVPSLLLGSILWCRLGASLGAAGKVWRVLTWVLLGLCVAALLAGLFLLMALSGGRWH